MPRSLSKTLTMFPITLVWSNVPYYHRAVSSIPCFRTALRASWCSPSAEHSLRPTLVPILNIFCLLWFLKFCYRIDSAVNFKDIYYAAYFKVKDYGVPCPPKIDFWTSSYHILRITGLLVENITYFLKTSFVFEDHLFIGWNTQLIFWRPTLFLRSPVY